jgi:hypothetical protein
VRWTIYLVKSLACCSAAVGKRASSLFTTGKAMFKRPSASDARWFYAFIAIFFAAVFIAALSNSEDINTTEPPGVSTRHQENAQDEVIDFRTAEHTGDEADLYADDLLSHFRSGGLCDTYSSVIRRFADSASPVNIRITKMNKILDKAHKYNCVQ